MSGSSGVVFLPSSALPYRCDTGLVGAINVSIKGEGYKRSILKAGAVMSKLLRLPTTAPDNYGGRVEGLCLDGGGNADYGLYLDQVVGWTFLDIRVMNALNTSLVLNNTQNCVFIGLDLGTTSGAGNANGGGIRFNHSASGNVFLRCEVNAPAKHGVVFVEDDAIDDTPGGWGTVHPQDNHFIGCIFERLTDNGTSMILMKESGWNTFDRCSFQIPDTVNNPIMLELNSATAFAVFKNVFTNCEFYMPGVDNGKTVIFLKTIAAYYTSIDKCVIGKCTTVFDTDATVNSIWLGALNSLTAGSTFWVGSGGAVQDSVINSGLFQGLATFNRQIVGAQGEYLIGLLDINHDQIRLRSDKTPASAAAAGDKGTICWDASYIYVCTATDTWKRVAIGTW